ncbi:hypothetical protein Tco_1185707 [Tanacetum coccineum]
MMQSTHMPAESPSGVSHMLEAQVKEQVLHHGLMSQQIASKPQVKELVLNQGFQIRPRKDQLVPKLASSREAEESMRRRKPLRVVTRGDDPENALSFSTILASSQELLPLNKRGHDRSSSSTSALPQAFDIGESSRKISLECHEEQIKEILNHLDELSLDRIEHTRYKNRSVSEYRMPPKRTSTSEAPAITQAAIRKLVADSVATRSG